MFNKPAVETQLDRTIAELELELQMVANADSKEYAKKVKQLKELHALRKDNKRKGVDPNTLLLIGGNLAGILIIVAYEHAHPLVSKALSQVGKMR